MDIFLHRLTVERNELRKKTIALGIFRGSEKIEKESQYQRDLLLVQHEAMVTYLDALNARITDLTK